jgi:hypothetical protein
MFNNTGRSQKITFFCCYNIRVKKNGQAGFYIATFIILCFLKPREGPADIFVITPTPEESLTDGLSPDAILTFSWIDKVIDISRTFLPPFSSVLELSPRV